MSEMDNETGTGFVLITVYVRDTKGTPISGAEIEDVDGYVNHINPTGVNGSTYISVNKVLVDGDLHINVSAPGYESKENITIYRTSLDTWNDDNEFDVELRSTSGYTYYTICVRDSENPSSFISGATVDVYNYSFGSSTVETTLITDSNGKCVFDTTDNYTFSINVSKNGYTTQEGIILDNGKASIEVSNNTPKYVNLVKSQTKNYYYVVYVKDNNNTPVSGVLVRMFTDFTMSSAWTPSRRTSTINIADSDITSIGAKELFVRVQTILSTVSSREISNIKASDIFSNYNQYHTEIVNSVNNKFHTSITVDDLTAIDEDTHKPVISKVGDLVELIRQNIPSRYKQTRQTVYETNVNGKIEIPLGESNNTPNPIYAKCTSLPTSGYEWTNYIGPSNQLPASADTNIAGAVFTINSVSGLMYYHSYRFVDTKTGKYVQGVNVKYMSNNELLAEKESDENGYVSYFCGLHYIDVKLSKEGYNNYIMPQSEGSDDPTDIYTISITPQNSIKVMYDSHCGDLSNKPAAGISVEIFFIDDDGEKISKGIYMTNDNGYIDTLPNGVYTSEGRYIAVVINYRTQYKYRLRVTIYKGHNNIIELPPMDESSQIENEFEKFNEMSINSIKKKINSNDNDNVSYCNTETNYKIRVVDPDSITVYDIFSGEPVMMNDPKKNVIGSINISLKKNINELRLKVINRYSGYYNPIFKDVLFYKNFKPDDNGECVYSNTSFDDTYEDNYGKFGIINNMWFHKANEENKEIITSLEPYYPLTGQYALDYRDYNIFESNWDMSHYTKQVDINTSKACKNISSMKEGLCMFGSKYLNVPEMIEIYGFTLGNDSEWKGEWNDNWITNPDGCPGEIMFKEINSNSVDFYLFMKKRIVRYFKDILEPEFNKYIANDQSFGKNGIDDDIEEYVTKNVLKLYKLEKVRMFVKRNRIGQHNSRIDNDYTTYLEYDKNCTDDYDKNYFKTHNLVEYFRQHNFIEVNNITMTKMNRDDFDRKIVYNLQSGYEEKFGFSFILKKI